MSCIPIRFQVWSSNSTSGSVHKSTLTWFLFGVPTQYSNFLSNSNYDLCQSSRFYCSLSKKEPSCSILEGSSAVIGARNWAWSCFGTEKVRLSRPNIKLGRIRRRCCLSLCEITVRKNIHHWSFCYFRHRGRIFKELITTSKRIFVPVRLFIRYRLLSRHRNSLTAFWLSDRTLIYWHKFLNSWLLKCRFKWRSVLWRYIAMLLSLLFLRALLSVNWTANYIVILLWIV